MIQEEQTITQTVNYKLAHILIQFSKEGIKADVQTTVTDTDGNFIKSIVNTYEGKEYNKWWTNFNNGTAIIQEIIDINSINVALPSNIEEEFVNIIKENLETPE